MAFYDGTNGKYFRVTLGDKVGTTETVTAIKISGFDAISGAYLQSADSNDSVVNNGDGSYTVNAVPSASGNAVYQDGYYHVSDSLRLFLPDDYNGTFSLTVEGYSQG